MNSALIENVRMSNVTDGYSINGWESEIIENHSGIVDCFRNPKGDPAILRYYNQPLYIAVKIRTTVIQPPAEAVADFFIINEKGLRGPYQLRATLRDSAGREITHIDRPVNLSGGDIYGELIAANMKFAVGKENVGAPRLDAVLTDGKQLERARGGDDIWSVSWRNDDIPANGARWETDGRVARFLEREKSLRTPEYRNDLGPLDWILTTRSPADDEPAPVSSANLHSKDGASGLSATLFGDSSLSRAVHQRVDSQVLYAVEYGNAPDPALAGMNDYSVRWEGSLLTPRPGHHTFAIRASGAVRLTVGGKNVIDAPSMTAQTVRGDIDLEGPVSLTLEFKQGRGNARCELGWLVPGREPTFAQLILERVRRDGTTLVILDHADARMPLIQQSAGSSLSYRGSFKVGRTWLGGVHFVREHPLMHGLPVNQAMDWPYQSVVRNGDERIGLLVEGEELVAGCYRSYPMQLGSVVGVIPLGRGRIVFFTLDIAANLGTSEGPAPVARKLLCNFLRYSAPSAPERH
jgi:beta-galactosidase